MLDQVDVSGFKALFESRVVRLRPLTVLIGRNGSGKSSFLEALQWLQESVFFGLSHATSARFGSITDLINRRSQAIDLDLLLDEGKAEVRYRLEVKPRAGAENRPIVLNETCRENRRRRAIWSIQSRKGPVGAAVRSLAAVRMNPVRDGDALALSAFYSPKPVLGAERLALFLRRAVFLRLSPTALARSDDMFVSERGPLVHDTGKGTVALLLSLKPEQRAWVAEKVRSVIEGVQSVRVKRRMSMAGRGYVELGERMRSRGGTSVHGIPAWLLSEGTRRLVTLFALLAVRPRPSLLAIEEIENGLDPWTLRIVFQELRYASEEGVQVLLTTHSPFLLDNVDPTEVLRVNRVKGDTTFTPVTDFQTVSKYRDVVAPGAMYLSGFLEEGE